MEVNTVEDVSGQSIAEPWMLLSGDIVHHHCRKSGHLHGECPDKKGQEENVRQRENQERLPRGRGDGPVGSTSKRCDVQEVDKRHTHERGLHPPMPELVVEEDRKSGSIETKQTATGTLQTPPGAQQAQQSKPGLVGLAAKSKPKPGLVGLAAKRKAGLV